MTRNGSDIPTMESADAPSGRSGGSGAPRPGTVPLLDLSAIDMSGRMIPRERINDYIPHQGDMALLDHVIWHRPDYTAAVALKRVRDDEFWCAGHIPGRPILPGVLMVEAGAQLASIMYFARMDHRNFAGFTRIENTVFRGMVVPGDDLYIVASEVKFHPKRFISDCQGLVQGKIVYESRITGMIL